MIENLKHYLRCPYDRGNSLLLYVFERDDENVITGILNCEQCARWFPIIDEIPSLLPDGLRNPEETEFLKSHKDSIPSTIKEYGLPFNLKRSERKNAPLESDLVKKKEMHKRDSESNEYDRMTVWKDSLEVPRTLKRIKPTRKDIVLEVGCGTGRFTKELISRAKTVIGVDFSRESLKILIKTFKVGEYKNYLLVHADATQLPLPDCFVQTGISCGVIEHIPTEKEREKMLDELNRVLAAGGEAVVSVYNHSIIKRIQYAIKKYDYCAKEGYHSNNEIYFYNYSYSEFKRIFSVHFSIQELCGIINYIPKIMGLMGKYYYLLDAAIESSPLSPYIGFMLLAKGKKR